MNWVKNEVKTYMKMLEISHKKPLSNSDMRVILRGKALEFYSKHYGFVKKKDLQDLSIKEALVGIDSIIDDIQEPKERLPPDIIESLSRWYLIHFRKNREGTMDSLHKLLRGTAITVDDFIKRGWIAKIKKRYKVLEIQERIEGKVPDNQEDFLKSDLDQAHLLIGIALPGSNIDLNDTLENIHPRLHPSVKAILEWYSVEYKEINLLISEAATRALRLYKKWEERHKKEQKIEKQKKIIQTTLDTRMKKKNK